MALPGAGPESTRTASLLLEHDPLLVRSMDLTAGVCVGCSLLLLALSGEFPIIITGSVVLALVSSLIWGRSEIVTTHRIFFNVALIVALAGAVGMAFYTGNYLYWTVVFLAAVQVVKFFERTAPTDMLQVLALSLLGLIAGAVAYPDLIFAIVFMVTVVAMTWALILLHFYTDAFRQVQDSLAVGADPGVVMAGLRRHVSRSFLMSTSAIALALFVCTAATFLLFPRMGLGFLFKGASTQAVSGFADRIELGHFGNIATDPTAAARVVVQGTVDQPPPAERLYLRGRSLDRYEGGRWEKTYVPRSTVVGVHRSNVLLPMATRGAPRNPPQVMRVYLEPMRAETPVLLVPQGTRALDLSPSRDPTGLGRPPRVMQDRDGDLVHDMPEGLRAVYDVQVVPNGPPAAARLVGRGDRLLNLPDDIKADLARIVAPIIAGRDTPIQKASRIEAHLRRNFKYTLEGDGLTGTDPILRFLEERREGHCEYFASAMVLLLRSAGVPARVVNGFAGGEWNRPGGFFVVRRKHAHSWVEAWLGDGHWSRFDPTPRSFEIEPGGALAGVRAWYDAMRMRWMRWVVTFNADKQLQVFRGARRGWHKIRGKRGVRDRFTYRNIGIAIGVGTLLLGAFLFWRTRRRRRGRGGTNRAADALLRRLRPSLQARYRPRHPSEPPVTWMRRAHRELAGRLDDGGASLLDVSNAAERCLYAPSSPDEKEREILALKKSVARARKALKPLPARTIDDVRAPAPPSVARISHQPPARER